MTDEEFKVEYRALAAAHGTDRLTFEQERPLADRYMADATEQKEARLRAERDAERQQEYQAAPRGCRVCGAALPPPSGRGRPPVNCDKHR